MKLTNLKRAWDHEVHQWLKDKFELTPYQESKMRQEELVRFAPFKFYKRRHEQRVHPLWRLTILLLPPYFIILIILMPLKMLFTGKWTYGQKFYDNFHAVWMRKIQL